MNPTSCKAVYTVAETAALLGVGRTTLLRAVRNEEKYAMELDPIRVGGSDFRPGRVVFPRATVDARLHRKDVTGACALGSIFGAVVSLGLLVAAH